jgi:hypothetical protein
VRIGAEPSNDLSVDLVAAAPAEMHSIDRSSILRGVGIAAVDELIAFGFTPFRGCRLTILEVGWHDVWSGEIAMYMAARGALAQLRKDGEWQYITGP